MPLQLLWLSGIKGVIIFSNNQAILSVRIMRSASFYWLTSLFIRGLLWAAEVERQSVLFLVIFSVFGWGQFVERFEHLRE